MISHFGIRLIAKPSRLILLAPQLSTQIHSTSIGLREKGTVIVFLSEKWSLYVIHKLVITFTSIPSKERTLAFLNTIGYKRELKPMHN